MCFLLQAPRSMPHYGVRRISTEAYSPKCEEGLFAEVRCATGRASLHLGSGPRLRHVHRFELLEDAQVIPACSYYLRNPTFGKAQGSGPRPPHLPARRRDGTRRALPFSLVGSPPGPDGGDLVPLGDLFFDRKPVVREGTKQQLGYVPGPLKQIGGHDLLQDGMLA